MTAFVADMAKVNAPGTILVRLQALYEMAKVLDADRDWQWIRHIESRIRARHLPVRSSEAAWSAPPIFSPWESS